MSSEEPKVGAVYVPWPTFINAINALAQAMPNRIDKSVFSNLSFGTQGQLLTGLKFLGLTAKDGRPTEALIALAVMDEGERQKQTAKILKASYAKLFDLDLARATQQELRDALKEHYGVSGDTLERALRFFLSGAQYAGIALSSLLTKGIAKPLAAGNGGRRRKATKKTREQPPPPAAPAAASGGGESKMVNLVSGGTLTLVASLGIMSLNQEDRQFVFELIDKFEAYASKHPATPTENETAIDEDEPMPS